MPVKSWRHDFCHSFALLAPHISYVVRNVITGMMADTGSCMLCKHKARPSRASCSCPWQRWRWMRVRARTVQAWRKLQRHKYGGGDCGRQLWLSAL